MPWGYTERHYPEGKDRIVCCDCGKIGRKISPKQKRCRDCTKLARAKPKDGEYYVYGWYHKDDCLPYYVGKGSKNRAWRGSKHGTQHRRVVIFQSGLSESQAFLIERTLIKIFRDLGAALTNLKMT